MSIWREVSSVQFLDGERMLVGCSNCSRTAVTRAEFACAWSHDGPDVPGEQKGERRSVHPEFPQWNQVLGSPLRIPSATPGNTGQCPSSGPSSPGEGPLSLGLDSRRNFWLVGEAVASKRWRSGMAFAICPRSMGGSDGSVERYGQHRLSADGGHGKTSRSSSGHWQCTGRAFGCPDPDAGRSFQFRVDNSESEPRSARSALDCSCCQQGFDLGVREPGTPQDGRPVLAQSRRRTPWHRALAIEAQRL